MAPALQTAGGRGVNWRRVALAACVLWPTMALLNGCTSQVTAPKVSPSSKTLVGGTVTTSEVGGTGLAIVSVLDTRRAISASGGFQVAVSSFGAQLLLLADSANGCRALAVSLPRASGSGVDSVRFDARSTALSLLLLTPGILAIDPVEARAHVARLAALQAFPALVTSLRQHLPLATLGEVVRQQDVSTLLQNCVREWQATDSVSARNATMRPTERYFFSATVKDVSNPFMTDILLENSAWRYVSVQRRDIVEPTFSEKSVTQIATGLGCMRGGTPVSWGTLLTWTIAQPTQLDDYVDFSVPSRVSESQYWIVGLGYSSGVTVPTSINQDKTWPALESVTYYICFPLLDILSGATDLMKDTGKVNDALGAISDAVSSSSSLGDLLHAQNAVDMAGSVVDLGVLIAEKVAEHGTGVAGGFLGVSQTSWISLSNVLAVVSVAFAVDNTIVFVDHLLTVPDIWVAQVRNPVDVRAPGAVMDLAVVFPAARSVGLSWTAPGDDGNIGTASQYDIRYATFSINESNWSSATPCAGEPSPKPAGASESFTVPGLSPSTPYYFAIKTADQELNWSALSNIAGATTQSEDITPPAAVTDLAAVNPTSNSMTLTWTAPGDDGNVGTASQYDIRYAKFSINESNWNSATQCSGEPTPKPAGSAETFAMTRLSLGTKYYFGLKTADEKPNWSGLSNVQSNSTICTAGSWTPLGAGMNGAVWAFAEYNGQLIAGGGFTTAGGVSANHIAAWDGSSWSQLGTGLGDYEVLVLTVYNGQLIAGGDFTTAGGVSANHIAAWNGSSWSPLGAGLVGGDEAFVLALTVYDGQLIAGGGFTTAGGVSANKIAAWNGSFWTPLGAGPNYDVWTLTVYNGQLIAAGGDESSANSIAAWNGASWSPLGTGLSYHVSSLTAYNGQLVAGGDFRAAPSIEGRIDTWNGSSWSALDGNLSGPVHSLTVYNGQLIAGGGFHTAGSVAANSVAVWNGSSWSPLCAGLNGSVLALTVLNDQLIVGGWFTTAGSVPANAIAAWE